MPISATAWATSGGRIFILLLVLRRCTDHLDSVSGNRAKRLYPKQSGFRHSGSCRRHRHKLGQSLGIAFSATSPFWVADNGCGLSTLYNSAGAVQAVVVTIPPPAGQYGPAAPTGIIANSVPAFLGTGAAAAHFLFSTEDGTISAWSSGSAAVLKVDYSTSNAVSKDWLPVSAV